MTAKKKTITRPKNSPAPAIKSTQPAAKKKAVVATPPLRVVPAPSKAAAPRPVAKVRPPAAKSAGTTIIANIDVGFGNALHLRGDGPGLNWDRGVLMTCQADDQWQITLAESAGPVVFKFLINDVTWSIGNDYTLASGQSGTFVPEF